MKEIEILSKILLSLLAIIAIYWLAQTSFYLMSTRSTLQNTAGVVLMVLLIACVLLFIIKKVKLK